VAEDQQRAGKHQPRVHPAADVRGEALAGLFLTGYLGPIIPALDLGIAARQLSAQTVTLWFSGVLLALLGTVVVLALRGRRHSTAPHIPA
jgi:hypothetical protein